MDKQQEQEQERTAEEEEKIREEVSEAKEEPRESVKKVLGYMGKIVRVTMTDGRMLTGTLICFDKRMNILLNVVTEERPITLPDGNVSYDSTRLASCIVSKKYWTKVELVKELPKEDEEEEKREE